MFQGVSPWSRGWLRVHTQTGNGKRECGGGVLELQVRQFHLKLDRRKKWRLEVDDLPETLSRAKVPSPILPQRGTHGP